MVGWKKQGWKKNRTEGEVESKQDVAVPEQQHALGETRLWVKKSHQSVREE